MTDRTISPAGGPLRRRMTEDMTVRGFTASTRARIHPGGQGFHGLFCCFMSYEPVHIENMPAGHLDGLQAASA